MTGYRFNESIKRCIRILGQDFFLPPEDLENAFKVADKVDFVGRPSVIAVSILYYQKPDLYDLIMFTDNITTDSLQTTIEKLKKVDL